MVVGGEGRCSVFECRWEDSLENLGRGCKPAGVTSRCIAESSNARVYASIDSDLGTFSSTSGDVSTRRSTPSSSNIDCISCQL